ncbi:MAG: hypothetical protein KDB27_31730, partial [Planctomycetales bacterium]|nr:hypothetical protein [Planctomycetales bacterium]
NDPSRGVNQVVLDQWESWFQILDDHGVLIYFFIYDDSSDPWKTADVEKAESAFVQTIVRSFKHHRNLIWVVAEESEEALSPVRAEQLARLIKAEDNHGHLIGNHHHSGTVLKGHSQDSAFDHFAMQLNVGKDDVYQKTREALASASGKYQLIYAENTETPQSDDDWRRHAWTVAMAGAMPMLLGMDVMSTSDDALHQCRILSEFFEDTHYSRMQPSPRVAETSPYVLRQASQSFIAWSESAGDGFEIDNLDHGTYELLWLDCQTGRRIEQESTADATQRRFAKPASIGSECALYGRQVVASPTTNVVFPGAEWQTRTPAELGLDEEKLRRFQQLAGGRGCIIKDGYLVSSWGDITRPGDLASASKPVYAHLLFRALELGKLESADDSVVPYRKCLSDLNPSLGFKDRGLTFRHLAFQSACLGYQEQPGNAFDYNDHTMGLFWDVLVNDLLATPWDQAHDLFNREFENMLQFQDGISFPTEGRTRGRPSMSPRDLARFGWLYLNLGSWKGRQMISQRHAKHASSDPMPLTIPRTNGQEAERCATRSIGGGGNQADHNGGYSWLWWVNAQSRDGRRWWADAPADMFCALGHCGQRGIAIMPTERIVVSWNDAKQLHCNRELGNEAFASLASAGQR